MMKAKPSFRIGAVTISCTDLARSIDFYERLLGAVRDPRDGYGCAWFKLGSVSISLMQNATAASPASLGDHPMAILWLETDNLTAAVARFEQHGVRILQPSDGNSIIVADPDGIVIEVWQAT
jgi:catechol 2,3-dioxygenase-like lactoylglutathione lyase family enzyme